MNTACFAGIHKALILLSIALASACGYEPTSPPSTIEFGTEQEVHELQRLPGSYIVTFKTPASGIGVSFPNFTSESREHLSLISAGRLSDPRVRQISFITSVDLHNPGNPEWQPRMAADSPLELRFGPDHRIDPSIGSIARVDFRSDAEAHKVLQEWEEEGALHFAEPNYLSTVQAADFNFANHKQAYQQIASEKNLWWHQKINLLGAFDAIIQKHGSSGTGAISPIIAIMDSGVDVNHPALADRIWTNGSPGKSACGQDINGCNTTFAGPGTLGQPLIFPYGTSDHGQRCLLTDNRDVDDFNKNCRHGTHVAGIVAANPASGAAGICPVCRIMVIRVVEAIEGKGRVPDSAILNGMKYVSLYESQGTSLVKVLNSSFGKFQRSRTVNLLVRILTNLGNGGILVVGAAGNEDTMKRTYPAAFDDALAVASIDFDGGKSSFSNFGPWVDIAAPGGIGGDCLGTGGGNVYSTLPGNEFGCLSGTSMAAPMVAGVAGLLAAFNPQITAQELKKRLIDSADDSIYLPENNSGKNSQFFKRTVSDAEARIPLLGAGQLNARNAIDNQITGAFLPRVLDRVKPGCATIGHKSKAVIPLFFLLLPLLGIHLVRNRS